MKASLSLISAGMLCLWIGAGPAAAHAQEPLASRAESGYVPLEAAAQFANESQALETASAPGATLAQKRRTLSDPSVAQALDLLRRWLDTPAVLSASPDVAGKGLTLSRLLLGVIALEKALAVRSYVLLADGRVGDAIDTLREGLRLSYAFGNATMSSRVTGVFIETTLTQQLLAHLDQFSELDCDRLLQLARDWANAPDPLPLVLERARLQKPAQIQKALSQESFNSLILELDREDAPTASQLERLTPQARQQLTARVLAAVNAAYAQAQLALRTPYWERAQLAASTGKETPTDPLVKKLMDMTMPDLNRSADRYTQTQATARLLGCRAAIRRYRWEYDRLPASLAQLKLGDMAIDPFTGKPFVYKNAGTDYTLESIGPAARENNPSSAIPASR